MKKLINICLTIIFVGSLKPHAAQSEGLAAVCETSNETLSEIMNSRDETLIDFMVAVCGKEVFDLRVINTPCEFCDANTKSKRTSLDSKTLIDDKAEQLSGQEPPEQEDVRSISKPKELRIVDKSAEHLHENHSILEQHKSLKETPPGGTGVANVTEVSTNQLSGGQPGDDSSQSTSRHDTQGIGVERDGDVKSKMENSGDTLEVESGLPLVETSAGTKRSKNYLTDYSSIERTIYKMFLEAYFGTASRRMDDQKRNAQERGIGFGFSFDIAQPEFIDLDPISLEFSAFTSNKRYSSVTNLNSQGNSYRGEITIPLNQYFSIGAGLEYDISRLKEPSTISVLRQHAKKIFVPLTYRTHDIFGQASSIQFNYLLSGDAFIDEPSGDGSSSTRFRVKSQGGYGLRFRYTFSDHLQYFIDYWKIRTRQDVRGQNALQGSNSITQWDLTFGVRVQR